MPPLVKVGAPGLPSVYHQTVRIRPKGFDVAFGVDEMTYVSYTPLAGEWMKGLFALRDIRDGDIVGRYTGAVYTLRDSERVADQQYMMRATMKTGKRRRNVIIDGNPSIYHNPMARANYAKGSHANAGFVNDRSREREGDTSIFVRATHAIQRGVEIRIDYDGNDGARPYMKQLLRDGANATDVASSDYKTVLWTTPRTLAPQDDDDEWLTDRLMK